MTEIIIYFREMLFQAAQNIDISLYFMCKLLRQFLLPSSSFLQPLPQKNNLPTCLLSPGLLSCLPFIASTSFQLKFWSCSGIYPWTTQCAQLTGDWHNPWYQGWVIVSLKEPSHGTPPGNSYQCRRGTSDFSWLHQPKVKDLDSFLGQWFLSPSF